jgi:hypothetical protein
MLFGSENIDDTSLINHRFNLPDFSSLVDPKVMPVLLAERSSSTHTVDGVLTVVELSPERISPRSTDPLRTLLDGSPSL